MNHCSAAPVRLWLVTGQPGAGKTAWCEAVIAAARTAGLEVRGLLSPGVVVAGRKVALCVRDIRTGEERPLAVRCERAADAARGWEFDAAALAWADARLRTVGRCHTLIVDEVGPLELRENRGWMSVWMVLRERAFNRVILTVRPALLALCRQRIEQLGDFECRIVSCPAVHLGETVHAP